MKRSALLLLTAVFALIPAAVWGGSADPAGAQTVVINGRNEVLVTRADLRLGDLAEVHSPRMQDDEVVIGLQKILIEKAPAPGQKATVTAETILDRLKAAGVDLKQIGYVLPRSIAVQRAGRAVTLSEVTEAVRTVLEHTGREVSIRRLDYREPVFVLPGELTLEAKALESLQPGRMDFALTAQSGQVDPVKFQIGAEIDEWKEIPVAAHPISKGALIGADDFKMAKMSLRLVPADAETEARGIVGLEAGRSIGFGEVFQHNKLVIPPMVTNGSKVILLYRTEMIEATATGIALESAGEGQPVKVRNEASRKVLTGTVLEPGLVGVRQ